jgi:hypothetical protein
MKTKRNYIYGKFKSFKFDLENQPLRFQIP